MCCLLFYFQFFAPRWRRNNETNAKTPNDINIFCTLGMYIIERVPRGSESATLENLNLQPRFRIMPVVLAVQAVGSLHNCQNSSSDHWSKSRAPGEPRERRTGMMFSNCEQRTRWQAQRKSYRMNIIRMLIGTTPNRNK